MLQAAADLGVQRSVARVSLPVAVAIFRVTSPAMNLAVAIYVAHWLGISLAPSAIAAGAAVAAITTIGSVSLPGQVSFRSEEHTSELQSLMRISYAVFCLKKKHNC